MGEIMQRPQSEPGNWRHRSPVTDPEPEEGLDMRRMLEALYRRRRTIIVALMTGFFTALLGALLVPRVYVARTAVLVQPTSSTGHLEDTPMADPRLVESQVETLQEFIRSSNFMAPLLINIGAMEETLPAEQKEKIIRAAQTRLSARTTGVNTFELLYTGSNPVMTVRLVDGVINGFFDVTMRSYSRSAGQAVEYLEAQMADYRRRMAASQDAIKRFQAAHADLLAKGPERAGERLSRVEDTMVESRMAALEAELRVKLLRQQLQNTPPTIVADRSRVPNPRVLAFQTSLSTAEAAYEALRSRYTDTHPEVRAKKREVDGLRAQLTAALREPTALGAETTRLNPAYERLQEELRAAENELRAAATKATNYQRLLTPAEREAKLVPLTRQKLERLETEAKAQEAVYNSLVGRLEYARIANQMEARQRRAMYQLIDPARLIPSGDGKRRLGILLGGMMTGLLLGLTLAAMQEMTDHTLHSVEDAERYTSLPVLGAIPLLPPAPRHALPNQWRRMLLLKGGTAVLLIALLFFLSMRTHAGQHFIRSRVQPTTAQEAGANARVPAGQSIR